MGCGRFIFGHIMGVNDRGSCVRCRWTLAVVGEVISIGLTWGPWEICIRRIGGFKRVERRFHVMANDSLGKEKLAELCNSTEKSLMAIHYFIEESCRKFPLLFLFNKKRLVDIFATAEIPTLALKCTELIQVDTLVFEKTDVNVTTAAVCGCEYVLFRTAASSRSGLVEWLKGINASLTGRLSFDIQELVEMVRFCKDSLHSVRVYRSNRDSHMNQA